MKLHFQKFSVCEKAKAANQYKKHKLNNIKSMQRKSMKWNEIFTSQNIIFRKKHIIFKYIIRDIESVMHDIEWMTKKNREEKSSRK